MQVGVCFRPNNFLLKGYVCMCSCPLVILHPGNEQGFFRVWIFSGQPFLGRPPLAPLMRAAFAFRSDLIEPNATAALFFIYSGLAANWSSSVSSSEHTSQTPFSNSAHDSASHFSQVYIISLEFSYLVRVEARALRFLADNRLKLFCEVPYAQGMHFDDCLLLN